MANLTQKRLMEMEEEMNRFEEEILTTKAAAAAAEAAAEAESGRRTGSQKMIIGASTYNQIQAQIANKAPPSSGTKQAHPHAEKPVVAGPLLPPPPPPPLHSQSSSTPSTMLPIRPPPPPPPAFVPHQLHHRPMPPSCPPFQPRHMPHSGPPCPPGMQMGNMPRMSGPMPPPPPPHPNLLGRPPGSHPPNSFMGRPTMPMNMGNNMLPFPFHQSIPSAAGMMPTTVSTANQSGVTLEKPKIVYSAPPMKRIIAKVNDPPATPTPSVEKTLKSPEPKKPRLEEAAKKQAGTLGIELNVPVETIEAEKKLNCQVPPPSSAPAESDRGEAAASASSDGTKKKKVPTATLR